MSNTATKTRPSDQPTEAPKAEAPKAEAPQVPATPKALDNVPETDAAPKATTATANSIFPASYAPQEVRDALVAVLLKMRGDGWTRPAISKITGFSDSEVWRAQNGKVHTSEMDRWVEFTNAVKAGTHQPPTSGRKPKAEDLQVKVDGLQAKVDAAIAKIAELDPKANVSTLRAALAEVKTALEA